MQVWCPKNHLEVDRPAEFTFLFIAAKLFKFLSSFTPDLGALGITAQKVKSSV